MPTKKTKKTTVKTTPVKEHKCECGENCKCHCHGGAHWVKHVIVWAIIFALGMVCGKMMDCGRGAKRMMKSHPVFVNGCLDVQSIKNPKLVEILGAADVDGNECVSVAEYRAAKKAMKSAHKGMRQGPSAEAPVAE